MRAVRFNEAIVLEIAGRPIPGVSLERKNPLTADSRYPFTRFFASCLRFSRSMPGRAAQMPDSKTSAAPSRNAPPGLAPSRFEVRGQGQQHALLTWRESV